MKAEIKFSEQNGSYYIQIDAENSTEELAIQGLRDEVDKDHISPKKLSIDLMGFGTFYPYDVIKNRPPKEVTQALYDALKTLIEKYWMNKNSDGVCPHPKGFIACITPDDIPDYWIKADEAMKKFEEGK